MQELTRITLHNEMDLILAHRRSMRLAELAGLSVSAQTNFATAVSEIAREILEYGQNGCLILQVNTRIEDRSLVATIIDVPTHQRFSQGLTYAKRLVSKMHLLSHQNQSVVELHMELPASLRINSLKLAEWRKTFTSEAELSPYEEIKRKNEQLQEMAQKLQKSEAQYRVLTNSLAIIVFTLNAQGNLVYANNWLKRFTGRSHEELNASRWKEVVHPDDYASFSQLIHHHRAAAVEDLKIQCRLRHAGAEEYYWHLASLSPLAESPNEQEYWIGYIVDIHAQKVVEETLKNNQELIRIQAELKTNQQALETNIAELNRSNQELERFAYVASHDLQEPLRKIMTFSKLLVQKNALQLEDESLLYLSRMTAAAQRMQLLIQNLLEFSRLGRKEDPYQAVDLNDVLSRILSDLDETILQTHARIESDPLPTLWAERTQMHQLFFNLLENSLKFQKKEVSPSIRINCQMATKTQIKRCQLSEDKSYHCIQVTDNGIGFEPMYAEQIFTIFQRLHGQNDYRGSGIGLAICRKIVEQHKGDIYATSTLGEGAIFTLLLPVRP